MPPQRLAERVLQLEEHMRSLRELPKRIDDLAWQVSQLRSGMHAAFSAIRSEMKSESAAGRGEMASEFAAVRGEMASGQNALRGEVTADFVTVRSEIGDLGRQMRVLHEDLVGRIAVLREGFPGAGRRRAKRR